MIERQAARAILLTPQQEILLFRIETPDGREKFWIAPGGGLEPGETIEAGLRRELREEVGLEHFVMGPLVWRRQHTFDWAAQRIRQYEEYYVIHVPRFEPRMSDALEMQVVDCFRWWPVAALVQAAERLTPLSLAEIVVRYLAEGPPREVPAVEVLVD
jgi:8-oxo-dGTP pyrophosphatase MutT (NUDIX family)